MKSNEFWCCYSSSMIVIMVGIRRSWNVFIDTFVDWNLLEFDALTGGLWFHRQSADVEAGCILSKIMIIMIITRKCQIKIRDILIGLFFGFGKSSFSSTSCPTWEDLDKTGPFKADPIRMRNVRYAFFTRQSIICLRLPVAARAIIKNRSFIAKAMVPIAIERKRNQDQ